jgi:hypothetical protein
MTHARRLAIGRARAKLGAPRPSERAMTDQPRLLSGGNPQIPKGHGDAPVQAWIAACPDWKRPAAARLDALVTRLVPGVRKAVKWNSPLYGAADADGTWFLGLHVFDRYIKVSVFNGAALDPPPPIGSKHPKVRYWHVEGEDFDEAQARRWIEQAAALPGERM